MSKIILNGIEYSNGITYQELQPVIYSTEEREIGVWTDGKPLYQKTINFGSLPANNGSKTVAHGISNLETLVNAVFVVQSSAQFRTLPNVSRGNVANQTVWYMTATDIGVLTGSNADVGSAYSGYVTIQYTKTTDTAGSGSWTPSGANAVHYSTNEQVIGTWVDGKPLYQKSFQLTTPSTTGSAIVIQSIADLNVDTPVNIYGNVLNVPINFVFDYSQNNYVACFVNTAKTGIAMKIGANIYANQSFNVTLQYTKTTD